MSLFFFTEVIDPDRPVPSAERIKAMENFLPTKNLHLAILKSVINFYPANHNDYDPSQRWTRKPGMILLDSTVTIS